MKYFYLILLLAFSFISINVEAQKKVRKKKFKPSSVCINEVFLHNDKDSFSFSRERYIFEWIEIFNGTSETVYLSDYFLTDDLTQLSKWAINPISRKNVWLKKKKFFPVYVHNRARRNGALLADFETPVEYLYLTKRDNDNIVVIDTIKLPSNNKYPYSRYPDGGDFTTTDQLTPGTENMLSRQSEPKNTYGVNFQLGQATSTSTEFPHSSRPAIAGGLGIYSRKNLGSLAMEYGIRFAIRGYHIDYSSTYPNSDTSAINEVRSQGRQTLYYIDLPYFVSTKIFRNIDVFGGPMFSIKIKSSFNYTTERTYTPVDKTLSPTYTKKTYHSNEGNSALDLINLSFVIGIRYQLNNNFNFSLYYMNDLTGLNIGSGNIAASQTDKGLFFSIGKPIFSGKKRVKKKSLF